MKSALVPVFFLSLFAAILPPRAAVPPAAPERFEKEIRAFEAADRTNPPPRGATLFVGSSSIRLWTNLAEAFPGWTTVRRGFGGAHLTDVNAFFGRLVVPYRPSKIVLYAGENDIAAGRSPQEVLEAFQTFAAAVRAKLPGTKVYFLSMKPSPSRWHLSPQIDEGNALIRRYALLRPGFTFIDVASSLLAENGEPDPDFYVNDQLHLNSHGYDRWTRVIRRAVEN